MCEVCERSKSLVDAIKPFLRDGVVAVKERHDQRWEDLFLVDTSYPQGKTIKITADGDHGGYFHWK